jgi:hypothetical protein
VDLDRPGGEAEPGKRYHPCNVAPSPSSPADLFDRVASTARRRPWEPWERPFHLLLDGRLLRLLCDPRQEAALDSFRASVARLSPDGGLPDLEMTPLAILDAIGVEIPAFPTIPLLEEMAALKAVEVGILIKDLIRKDFKKEPKLEPAHFAARVEETRRTVSPAAHDLFDLCVTRAVSRDSFHDDAFEQITMDALFTFRFPEEYRERMASLFNSFLLNNTPHLSSLTKVRRLKTIWDRSLERLLRKHPRERGEILAVDQEIRPRTYKDFLGWEVIHLAILGLPGKRVDPVIAFTPEPEERLRPRCRAHKTALRAFLDDIPREELAGELHPLMATWRPGWLVPCRADGTLGAPVSTAEVPVWAGTSPG